MTLSDFEWLSNIFADTKHRAASLRQQSFLLLSVHLVCKEWPVCNHTLRSSGEKKHCIVPYRGKNLSVCYLWAEMRRYYLMVGLSRRHCQRFRGWGDCNGELLMVKGPGRQLTTVLLFAAKGHQKIPKDDCKTMHQHQDIYFFNIEIVNRTNQQ